MKSQSACALVTDMGGGGVAAGQPPGERQCASEVGAVIDPVAESRNPLAGRDSMGRKEPDIGKTILSAIQRKDQAASLGQRLWGTVT